MDDFNSKKIAILGYGVEGKSLCKLLIKKNPSRIDVFDKNDGEIEQECQTPIVSYVKTNIHEKDLTDYDFVFRSPGIKREDIRCSDEKILSLTDLFLSSARGKIVAVTGTKGKSTTVLLINSILKQNKKRVFIGGNIGNSPLDFLDRLDDESYSVLELSSFQLQDLKNSATIAVILPIFPDHLDYHKDEQEYYLAKKNIFVKSDATKIISASENYKLLDLSKEQNRLILFSEDDLSLEEHRFALEHQVPPVDLAAAKAFAISGALKIDLDRLGQDFKKLPLRIEFIGNFREVRFYNDSASTNPISTQNAIDMMNGNTVLIIGGKSKGLDLTDLCHKIASESKITSVYLFGSERKNVNKLLKQSGYKGKIEMSANLDDVFIKLNIKNVANVLFSPSFASFDQYKNYKERGEHFNKLFRNL